MSASTHTNDYALLAELKGSQGALNVLTFSNNGKLLLSAGDDLSVRVWNTDDFHCEQVLRHATWGQVTALSWIDIETGPNDIGLGICVGTGRGSLTVCPMAKDTTWFLMRDATHYAPFVRNDAIEKQAYDALNKRLAVASHSGQIEMFSVESGKLIHLWTVPGDQTIPRGLLFFGDANQSLLTVMLDNGEMACRDAQTSTRRWKKSLTSAIGNVVLSPDDSTLVVDNLNTGRFDLYPFPASSPSFAFSLESTRHFVKQCTFVEGTKIVACGGHQGKIDLVDTSSGDCVSSLTIDKETNLIQVVAATPPNSNKFLVAGGSNGANPSVYLWGKKRDNTPTPSIREGSRSDYRTVWQQNRVMISCVLVSLLVNYPHLAPYLRMLATFFARWLLQVGRWLDEIDIGVNEVANEANNETNVVTDLASL